MSQDNLKFKITFGGWYQRTTLHLTEIYDLFNSATSHLPLNHKKLLKIKEVLQIKSVLRQTGNLEWVEAITAKGIVIKYFEDGLYTLSMQSNDIIKSKKELEDYYNHRLQPAINYIFSLGAPTPKILANIQTVHPTVVTYIGKDDFNIQKYSVGKPYSQIKEKDVSVIKTPTFIILSATKSANMLDDLVEMQIFFREFKDQLEKYLNIHRTIWEEITDIKSKKQVKGTELAEMREKLDNYATTVNLISNRINQMGTYIGTRKAIASSLGFEQELVTLFQYKFEVLQDTLSYIKEIWRMTQDYLSSAISIIVEVQNKSTESSIKSLRLITTIGVVSGLIAYLGKDSFPKLTVFGLAYFAILIAISLIGDSAMSFMAKRRRYQLKFKRRVENI